MEDIIVGEFNITGFKSTIFEDQAKELINKLNLVSEKTIFNSILT